MNEVEGCSRFNLSSLIYSGRWMLAPIYLAIIPAGLVYMYKYFSHLTELIYTAPKLNDTEMLLGVLHLIDMVMVCNLLVVTMIGGYSLFVRRIRPLDGDSNRLTWLDQIDPTTLKVKWGMALIGVSSIHLLEAFIGAQAKSWDELGKLIVIHLVFVVSTLGVAVLNKKH